MLLLAASFVSLASPPSLVQLADSCDSPIFDIESAKGKVIGGIDACQLTGEEAGWLRESRDEWVLVDGLTGEEAGWLWAGARGPLVVVNTLTGEESGWLRVGEGLQAIGDDAQITGLQTIGDDAQLAGLQAIGDDAQ